VTGRAALLAPSCALAAGLAAGLAQAAPQTHDCALTRKDGKLHLQFYMDTASFAPPVNRADPPRRTVSRVTLGDTTFAAEAILTEDGTRGFWAPGRDWLLTLGRDGTARMSDETPDAWTGQCVEIKP
jgi:hypothetical protein